MPIIGAVMAAALMVPAAPTILKIGIAAKTAYNAVKQIIKATSFAVSLVFSDVIAVFRPSRKNSYSQRVNKVTHALSHH
jgi:hypothetical protein